MSEFISLIEIESQANRMSVPEYPYERSPSGGSNLVLKSGPLYISSKGLGWKSWKRRWFMLTQTSLIFFKNDPNAPSQRGNELNLALGGIDLSNSGSVLVREDKKLLTVLFIDGRAFTLKAETLEDLKGWKAALERVLVAAPNAALMMGQNRFFRNESIDAFEGSSESDMDRRPEESMVAGRPIFLSLEDIDGSPSFLERALRFIEQHGVKVEGILRQSADVDDVDQRVHNYEQGMNQFLPDEDPHVVGDCIKYVLRELPSSPVPTPCCTLLLEAYRIEAKDARIAAMRTTIAKTFPEPNRRLLQRVLKMMYAVAAHSAENRMTASAVATCMAPLLLKPLLAGECGLEDDSDASGDDAAQLLAATAAANNAQAIILALLEDYDTIFGESQQFESSPAMRTEVEDSKREGCSEQGVFQMLHDEYCDAQNDLDAEFKESPDQLCGGKLSYSSYNANGDVHGYKVGDSEGDSLTTFERGVSKQKATDILCDSVNMVSDERVGYGRLFFCESLHTPSVGISHTSWGEARSAVISPKSSLPTSSTGTNFGKSGTKCQSSVSSSKWLSILGLSSVLKKNASIDPADLCGDVLAIEQLEASQQELYKKISKEIKENIILQASLGRRKQALYERRIALEQDVERLQEQLQLQRGLRAALEIGLSMPQSQFALIDAETHGELEEIAIAEAYVSKLKNKVFELHAQVNQLQQLHKGSLKGLSEHHQLVKNLQEQLKILQQELDLTLTLCQHEQEESIEIEGKGRLSHATALEQEALKAKMRGLDLWHDAVQ